MIRFLKRHSMDLSKKNNKDKGDDITSNDDNKINSRISMDKPIKLSLGEINVVDNNDDLNNSGTFKLNIDNNDELDDNNDNNDINPCKGLSFSVGVSENKNSKYRRTMEDVHTYVANFCERLDWGYFGVFDGHAGKQTARWAGTNLHNLLYDSIINDKFNDLRENLNYSFLEADKEIAKLKDVGSSGCTAAVAVLRWEEEVEEDEDEDEEGEGEREGEKEEGVEKDIKSNEIYNEGPFDFIPSKKHRRILYTANVGDSRIVINRNGKAKRLTYEHKGSDKNEIKRIYKSGGLVLGGRVNGVLAVSRSLGDIYLKEFVLGNPYTTMTELNEGDKFIIIACDGLWDVCDDQEAVSLIKDLTDAKIASEKLCTYAIQQGTSDNVTVMVVMLDTRIFGYTKM